MIGYPRYETKMVKKLVFLSTRVGCLFLELLWIERQLVKKTSKPQWFILDPVKHLWGSIFVKLVNISLKLGNYCKKNPSYIFDNDSPLKYTFWIWVILHRILHWTKNNWWPH